ncbi:MAG: glycosyltransferase [Streptosporangiaceae bacterium]|nr:glycosyltransferase [Streptosporangiaceae bacterium]
MPPCPQISVVIPVRSQARQLARTLECLVDQLVPASDFEVVVSGDGPSDADLGVARSYERKLRLRYCSQEDMGFRLSAARNRGARLAAAPVLAFLEPGVLPNRGYVTSLIKAHGRRCAVTGYVYGFNWFRPPVTMSNEIARLSPGDQYQRLHLDRRFRDIRHYEFAQVEFDLGRLAAPWWLFWRGSISIRADDFWRVGGFDEDFRSWGGEDVELGLRLTDAGIPLALSREAWAVGLPVDHDHGNDETAIDNTHLILAKHRTPLVEMCVTVAMSRVAIQQRARSRSRVEPACHALLSWAREARGITVTRELDEATAGTGDAPRRVAVVGCGGAVPQWWATAASAYTLLDFDGDLLRQARGSGPFRSLHAIGAWTGFPDKAFDLVVISSRLRGLWERLGAPLLAEASRIGHEVVVAGELRG